LKAENYARWLELENKQKKRMEKRQKKSQSTRKEVKILFKEDDEKDQKDLNMRIQLSANAPPAFFSYQKNR
jgi:hypothetical protein